MKKIELHLHLDGSIDPSFASELVGEDISEQLIGSGSNTLKEYLEKFSLPIQLLQEEEHLEKFSYLLGKSLEQDEVIYAEVRFCPLFHVDKVSVDCVVQAILRGFQKVSTVKVNLIFCMMRNFSEEKNKEIIELTEKYLNHGVGGIDLAGDEAHYSTSQFEELFQLIKSKNIPFTIHAGEADSYQSVDSALKFGAKRIGHGIQSIDSDETIHYLVEHKILLEICPTSNLDTHVIDDIKNHPIKRFVDAGVLISINTDNRTVSNTSLTKEFQLLKQSFSFTDGELLEFQLNAIDGAFLSDIEKEELRDRLITSN